MRFTSFARSGVLQMLQQLGQEKAPSNLFIDEIVDECLKEMPVRQACMRVSRGWHLEDSAHRVTPFLQASLRRRRKSKPSLVEH
jgi:hypothetical protein